MQNENKEILNADIRGVLVETEKGKKVLIEMNEEVVEYLFGGKE